MGLYATPTPCADLNDVTLADKEAYFCIRGCSHIMSAAGGGGVRKMLTNMGLWVLRMWIERTIDSNLTVYVKHCLNYHIFRVLVCWTTGKDDKLKFGGVF